MEFVLSFTVSPLPSSSIESDCDFDSDFCDCTFGDDGTLLLVCFDKRMVVPTLFLCVNKKLLCDMHCLTFN